MGADWEQRMLVEGELDFSGIWTQRRGYLCGYSL